MVTTIRGLAIENQGDRTGWARSWSTARRGRSAQTTTLLYSSFARRRTENYSLRIPFLDLSHECLRSRQAVLKIHSRCDLVCDYCYDYEHADQSWRGRFMVIAPGTVGITIVGDRPTNDLRLRYASGRSTYDQAVAPPNLDFLLPHMLSSIINTSRGGASGTESLGLAPSDVAVLETNSTIEQVDSVKVAYDDASAAGLDVFRHTLDASAGHPAIRARQRGVAGLSATCQRCPVVGTCGGLYAHRYRTGSGFANPSVYCADLEKIITHVRAGDEPHPGWRHATERHAGGFLVPFGDSDPYRDCHYQLPVTAWMAFGRWTATENAARRLRAHSRHGLLAAAAPLESTVSAPSGRANLTGSSPRPLCVREPKKIVTITARITGTEPMRSDDGSPMTGEKSSFSARNGKYVEVTGLDDDTIGVRTGSTR